VQLEETGKGCCAEARGFKTASAEPTSQGYLVTVTVTICFLLHVVVLVVIMFLIRNSYQHTFIQPTPSHTAKVILCSPCSPHSSCSSHKAYRPYRVIVGVGSAFNSERAIANLGACARMRIASLESLIDVVAVEPIETLPLTWSYLVYPAGIVEFFPFTPHRQIFSEFDQSTTRALFPST
jgi:hypothetical protein